MYEQITGHFIVGIGYGSQGCRLTWIYIYLTFPSGIYMINISENAIKTRRALVCTQTQRQLLIYKRKCKHKLKHKHKHKYNTQIQTNIQTQIQTHVHTQIQTQLSSG